MNSAVLCIIIVVLFIAGLCKPTSGPAHKWGHKAGKFTSGNWGGKKWGEDE